tara:strand:- start:1177 stop:2553 length:1377 start_codon:yes stop_codon:yes gene_type:complete
VRYEEFLNGKLHQGCDSGFDPVFLPDVLFGFQRDLVSWAILKGRAAIFADCGLGKTLMQFVWAENVVRKTGGNVLILTPLAVAGQMVTEAEKFGIELKRSNDGKIQPGITVTNYEKLHHFDASQFAGVVCDESSILKSFNGARKGEITEFMKRVKYRLLATATAAPNDYVELGTSSEALGYMGHMDMLNRFFKNDQNNSATGRLYGEQVKWRLKGHAELPFWRWVCSWARAVRKPSDLGFDDGPFVLPSLREVDHMVEVEEIASGMLFHMPAHGLKEQRDERKRSVRERCDAVAKQVVGTGQPALVWCHGNDEGNLMEKLIPDSVQVAGSDSDEAKEEAFRGFCDGSVRVLITKPKIGAWGLNFQHCNHVTWFPSHSYEGYYQAVRRCWRFGQKRPVTVDVITTEGERAIMANMRRKSRQADEMFGRLVEQMSNAVSISREDKSKTKQQNPQWLLSIK